MTTQSGDRDVDIRIRVCSQQILRKAAFGVKIL